MAKPRLIILVRHGQSEGNKNREIHQTIPDHRVKLTPDGWQQAYDAGRRLRAMLRADDTIQVFTSPYRRTRETTEGLLATLTSDDPDPSPFKRNNIKVYEEPRLREQDFGNFQPCSAEMERMWQERADYGHFFYRIPNGESAADAYDRISGFNESLWRQFGEDDFPSVCVLVTHGLMSRVFLMKWYHFSVEYFEDLRNINHCEFLIMRKSENSKYILDTKLRTWSELRRERERARKEKETNGTVSKEMVKLERTNSASSPVVPRKWGGCPNGCNHDKNFKIRSSLADLVKRDGTAIYPSTNSTISPIKEVQTNGASPVNGTTNGLANGTTSTLASRRPAARRLQSSSTSNTSDEREDAAPRIDINRAREEVVSSPDGTPSYISVEDRLRNQLISPNIKAPLLHIGRDGGGTYSGHTSRAGSDADSDEDERHMRDRLAKLKLLTTPGLLTGTNGVNGKRDTSGMRRGWLANRLGDSPPGCCCEHDHDDDHDCDHEHEHALVEDRDPDLVHDDHDCEDCNPSDAQEIDEIQKEECSIEGSVY